MRLLHNRFFHRLWYSGDRRGMWIFQFFYFCFVKFVNLDFLLYFPAPPVTNIKPITTTQEEHKPTTNTIPLNINTTYFNIDENGKQVFGGIAVCAESKCKGNVLKR